VADTVDKFKTALDQVPLVLLGSKDARVLTDARTSANVLESLLSSPISIVFVGSTGVGKSHLVNSIAGMDVATVGDLRPTTTSVVTAGSSGPAAIDRASEYVYVPSMPRGVAVVDTPAWASDRAAVIAASSKADVGVLVVSPSRYADAATAELWDALQVASSRAVILNRLRGTQAERVEILESVQGQFNDFEILVVEEMGETGHLIGEILDNTVGVRSRDERVVIARAGAVEAARHIAGVATAGSIDLGRVATGVEEVVSRDLRGQNLTVRETWSETEEELVEAISESVGELDRSIIESVDNSVALRVLDELGTWQSSASEADLDGWQIDVATRFRSNATIRWRRHATEQMLDRESWKTSVNSSVRLPKRMRRVMKSRLGPATIESHDWLVAVFDDAVEQRRNEWRKAVGDAASFRPGELLSSAQALEDQ
jgi:hypothetical protein